MALSPAMLGALGQQPPAPQSGGDTVDILRQMIDLAKNYIDAEQDEDDKLTMTKVLTTLQQYLAAEQKERDDAMQGKASPKMLRSVYGA